MLESKVDAISFIVDREEGNIRSFLYGKGLSRRLFLRYFNRGRIFLNGQPVARRGRPVKVGDLVEIFYEDELDSILPQEMELDIVYENDNLLIVHKQGQQVVHPIKHYREGTLLNGLKHYFLSQGLRRTPRLINRLDKDTEGLILVAKNPVIDSLMSSLIKERKLSRKYILLVHGRFSRQEGLLIGPSIGWVMRWKE